MEGTLRLTIYLETSRRSSSTYLTTPPGIQKSLSPANLSKEPHFTGTPGTASRIKRSLFPTRCTVVAGILNPTIYPGIPMRSNSMYPTATPQIQRNSSPANPCWPWKKLPFTGRPGTASRFQRSSFPIRSKDISKGLFAGSRDSL